MSELRNDSGLFESLTSDMTAEDVALATLQGVIAGEIMIKRQQLGMHQSDLAEKLGVSQGLVSRWESGETDMKLSTLVRIASALDLEMQIPFVMPAPPRKSYGGNVISFSDIQKYQSGSSSISSSDYQSDDVDLEEM